MPPRKIASNFRTNTNSKPNPNRRGEIVRITFQRIVFSSSLTGGVFAEIYDYAPDKTHKTVRSFFDLKTICSILKCCIMPTKKQVVNDDDNNNNNNNNSNNNNKLEINGMNMSQNVF